MSEEKDQEQKPDADLDASEEELEGEDVSLDDAEGPGPASLEAEEVDDEDLGDEDPDGGEPVADVAKPPPRKRSSSKGSGPLQGVTRAKLDDPKVAKEVWAKLQEQLGDSEGRPYAISEVFAPDDIVEHKTFGQGFVIATPGGDKVDVLFADQVRRLVQGR